MILYFKKASLCPDLGSGQIVSNVQHKKTQLSLLDIGMIMSKSEVKIK